MPTYDYRCDECGHAFEKFQSMSAAHIRKCPECGKNKLKRLIGTGAAVIFKGGGFYETDYRGDSYKKAAEADKAPSEKAETKKSDDNPAKTETKAETKAETKSESKPAKPDKPKKSDGEKK